MVNLYSFADSNWLLFDQINVCNSVEPRISLLFMRYPIYFFLLLFPVALAAQQAVVEKTREYLDHKSYQKATTFINRQLDKTVDPELKAALWYFKGKALTQQYFEEANTQWDNDLYRQHSYQLLEGIAAFQNAAKYTRSEYSEKAFRQIGGLHRFLKEMAFSYLQSAAGADQQNNYERFYLNLQWARNCDRFVQQYIPENTPYQMDTMLIYLTAWAAELTGRSHEARSLYETLQWQGISEEQMFIDHYNMLMALDQPAPAGKILNQALVKYPESSTLIRHKLHWLMTHKDYEEAIHLIDDKLPLIDQSEVPRFYFIQGMAWNALYDAVSGSRLAETYFQKAEAAYQQAIALQPSSFDYVYNLAALYYNKVVTMAPDAPQQQDYAQFMQKTIKTLEATQHLNAHDRKVIEALKDVYQRTNQTEKLRQLQQSKG